MSTTETLTRFTEDLAAVLPTVDATTTGQYGAGIGSEDEPEQLRQLLTALRETNAWDDNPSNQVHRIVRRLVQRAKDHVPIETVLCDREFDSKQVFQTLSNLDVNYLIPKRVSSSERDVLKQMEEDDQDR